jgi:hypothetical protein
MLRDRARSAQKCESYLESSHIQDVNSGIHTSGDTQIANRNELVLSKKDIHNQRSGFKLSQRTNFYFVLNCVSPNLNRLFNPIIKLECGRVVFLG